MLLFLAADLLWATKIKSTADALGIPARPVRSADMLAARLADSPVRALLVDLDAGEVALDLIRQLRAQPAHAVTPVIAFGPHVLVEAFQAAKAAGASTVMARGALQARLPEVLRALDQSSPVGSDLHD